MRNCLFILLLTFQITSGQENGLPEDFVYVKEFVPEVILEMRYADDNNFIGQPIPGYKDSVAILTRSAAEALQKVQKEVAEKGLCIKIFDAYRPQHAVDHFVKWAQDKNDTLNKQQFYPDIPKEDLFELGYIASRSGHTRGSTVDLTLVDCETGKELDMGSSYDFFGEISHHNSTAVSPEQKKNRRYLKKVMMKYGFSPYSEEWWHYTLEEEPFPETYFNFVVE